MVWRAFSWTIDSLIVRGMSALDPFYLVKEEIQDSVSIRAFGYLRCNYAQCGQ